MTLRVLTLSTLFPDASRPNFGVFVEQQTLGLAARPGVEVEVVAPVGLPPFPLSLGSRHKALRGLPPRETWKGVSVHRPRFRSLPGRPAGTPAAIERALLPRLRELRTRFPFDVIDAQFFWPDGPAAMRLSAALGVPFSVKARGSDIQYWGKVGGVAPQILAAGRAAGGLLAVSAALKEVMAGLGMPAERIAVHYTGIDRDRFAPIDRAAAKAALGIAGPLIVTVGALIPRKGQAMAIEAAARLPGATLLIVGAGPDHARLQALIDAKGLADRVRLTGPLPHAEIPALLGAADAMLLMSSAEGLANVWVEAMACGTPIVIGDIGGAREALRSHTAGRIAAFEPQAVADAVCDVLHEAPDPQAVRREVDRFSWKANAEALEAHLRRVAAGA
jgi:glycosyltransferase involved in cell wall biosynthesis